MSTEDKQFTEADLEVPVFTEETTEPVSEVNENPYVIFFVGEVSSGKSACVNSFAGGLISNSSLQRETLNLLGIEVMPGVPEDNITAISSELEAIHKSNNQLRNNLMTIDTRELKKVVNLKYPIPSRYALGKLLLVDFPGINDCGDTQKVFMEAFKSNISSAHLVVYVTDASKAFLTSSETKNFREIKRIIDQQNSNGSYIDLIILANKYDDVEDESYKEVFDRIPGRSTISKDKVLKYSSHSSLLKNIVDHKLFMNVPKTSNNYLYREVVKMLKSADARLDKRGEECLQRDCLLPYDSIKFKRPVEDENTRSLFEYIIDSREQNMTRQLTSHFENLDKNLNVFIQSTTFKDAVRSWRKMNLDCLLFNQRTKLTLLERLLNCVGAVAIPSKKQRLIPLEILFGFSIRNKYHDLSYKIIDLITKNFDSLNFDSSVIMFKDYITSQEKVAFNWINWFSHVFSDDALYNGFYEFYDNITNSVCHVDYGTYHPMLVEMGKSPYTPMIVKRMIHLSSMDMTDVIYLEKMGVLIDWAVSDNELEFSLLSRVIFNIRYCSSEKNVDQEDSDLSVNNIFAEYCNSNHRYIHEKIKNVFENEESFDWDKTKETYDYEYDKIEDEVPKKAVKKPQKKRKESSESSENTVDTSSYEYKKKPVASKKYSDTSSEEERPVKKKAVSTPTKPDSLFETWVKEYHGVDARFCTQSVQNTLQTQWETSAEAKKWRQARNIGMKQPNPANQPEVYSKKKPSHKQPSRVQTRSGKKRVYYESEDSDSD